MVYLVKLPGLKLTTGGQALVGESYERNEFRTTEFTFNRRLDQKWIILVVEEEPEEEPEEEEEETKPVEELFEELGINEEAEEDDTESSQTPPDGFPTIREGMGREEWWQSSESAGGRSRYCRYCRTKFSNKDLMFEHCFYKSSEEE